MQRAIITAVFFVFVFVAALHAQASPISKGEQAKIDLAKSTIAKLKAGDSTVSGQIDWQAARLYHFDSNEYVLSLPDEASRKAHRNRILAAIQDRMKNGYNDYSFSNWRVKMDNEQYFTIRVDVSNGLFDWLDISFKKGKPILLDRIAEEIDYSLYDYYGE